VREYGEIVSKNDEDTHARIHTRTHTYMYTHSHTRGEWSHRGVLSRTASSVALSLLSLLSFFVSSTSRWTDGIRGRSMSVVKYDETQRNSYFRLARTGGGRNGWTRRKLQRFGCRRAVAHRAPNKRKIPKTRATSPHELGQTLGRRGGSSARRWRQFGGRSALFVYATRGVS